MTSRRFLAWTCLLLVLVALAAPAAAGPQAMLAPAGPVFVVLAAMGLVRAIGPTSPPDRLSAVVVPARAPPPA